MRPNKLGLPRTYQQIALTFGLLGLILLTVPHLNHSLWRDEASSVWFANQTIPTLLTNLCDPHPPGYYLTLRGWQQLGSQEFWLRMPSLGAALLAVACLYRLGRTLGGQRWAWLAALLLAWQPLQIWYAAEVRMYALAQVTGLLLVWLGWQMIIAKPEQWWKRAIPYGVVTVLAFGVDYSVLLPFGLLQSLWLAQGYSTPKRWLSLQGSILGVALILWVRLGTFTTLGHSYQPVFLAIQANQWGLNLTPDRAALLLSVAFLSLGVGTLFLAWQWSRLKIIALEHRYSPYLWLAIWFVILFLAAIPRGYTIKRLLIVLLPYLALITAYALSKLPRGLTVIICLTGLLISIYSLPRHPREPWREMVSNIVASSTTDTPIYVDELVVPVWAYYLQQHSDHPNIQWVPLGLEGLTESSSLALALNNRVSLVTQNDPYRQLVAALPQSFVQNYEALASEIEPGISYYIYQKRETPLAQSALPQQSSPNWGLLLPSPLTQCGKNSYFNQNP